MAKQGTMLRRLSELTRRGTIHVDATYTDMQALGGAAAADSTDDDSGGD
jgi:hypothetical protein